jgi:hypothetical protein
LLKKSLEFQDLVLEDIDSLLGFLVESNTFHFIICFRGLCKHVKQLIILLLDEILHVLCLDEFVEVLRIINLSFVVPLLPMLLAEIRSRLILIIDFGHVDVLVGDHVYARELLDF